MLKRVGPLMLWEGFSQIVHRGLPGAVGAMKLLRRSQGGRPRALVSLFSHKAQLLTAMHQPALAFANALAGVNIGDTVPDDAEYVRACAMMTSVASWSSRQWAIRTASVYVQNALKLSRKLGGKNLPITLIMAGKALPRLDLWLASPLYICTGTGLTPATAALGPSSRRPHLHRDWDRAARLRPTDEFSCRQPRRQNGRLARRAGVLPAGAAGGRRRGRAARAGVRRDRAQRSARVPGRARACAWAWYRVYKCITDICSRVCVYIALYRCLCTCMHLNVCVCV